MKYWIYIWENKMKNSIDIYWLNDWVIYHEFWNENEIMKIEKIWYNKMNSFWRI